MIRRIPPFALIAAATVLLMATPAAAGNVHYKGGPRSGPSFTDQGLVLNARGDLAGLGSANVLVSVSARADVESSCTNPSGATQPAGQNPTPITTTGSQAIPASAVKNGNVTFNVSTNPPNTPIAGAPDCPNPKWTEAITDLLFTSATITVEQPQGTVVLTTTCSFSPHTTDGAVPSGTVTCSST